MSAQGYNAYSHCVLVPVSEKQNAQLNLNERM